ncbi:MAG: winged helix-turn-helix domain-containing protein [Acidobacteria bacterium]|nr:winged helix-turn-helix domain-containing protein [Acidobacteriota bacterium]
MTSNLIGSPPADGAPEARITVGDLVVDRERFRVTVADEPAPLTYMEFETLYVIAGGGGRVVGYDQIAEALWGAAGDDHRDRLAVLVSRIRSKIRPAARYLQTVRQVGYRLTPAPA